MKQALVGERTTASHTPVYLCACLHRAHILLRTGTRHQVFHSTKPKHRGAVKRSLSRVSKVTDHRNASLFFNLVSRERQRET